MERFNDALKRSDIPKFTHLKVHSSYSLGIGLNTPDEICAHAKRVGYDSVALTDVQGTYGFVEFHLAAKKYGIKPIYGVIVHHLPVEHHGAERSALTVLATTRSGLRQVAALASLSTAASDDGGAIDLDVIGPHAEGLVAFAGAADSEIGRMVLDGDEDKAHRVLGVFREIFGDRVFVEIQDHGVREERALAERLLALAADERVAPLLTQEVRYLDRGVREMYGTFRGIRHPGGESDFFKIDQRLADWSMRSALEISQLHPFYQAAYENTARVDDMIEGDLLGAIDREGAANPSFSPPVDSAGELIDRCARGFGRRMGDLPDAQLLKRRTSLEHEAGQAVAEGLGPTLVLFQQLLQRLREARVGLGPATGLSLQSLCAYLLGITLFDPYRYDDEFQPAFDSRSNEVREFEVQLTSGSRSYAMHALFEMFEFGAVAYLPVVERITPSKAVKMVGAVVDVSDSELQEIQRIITRHPGVSIKNLYDQDRHLGRLYKRSISARDLLTRAAALEDLPMGMIRSRRSLALSGVPLTDFLGHSVDSETGDLFVQAGRDGFPAGHMYRLDVTSLSALSVAVRADADLRRTEAGDYGWERFSVVDRDVWRNVQSGDTEGIFLFEGPATLQQRESFQLESMGDLTNFLALMRGREGDQSLSERFNSYREDGEVVGDTEGITAILQSTGGHILYHEQLRDIISMLAGKSPSDAWKMVSDLRSGTPSALSSVRKQFMMGAAETGVGVDAANQWFERLLRRAKTTISHKRVFADALLVYKLFFLKTHHEVEFFNALLNANRENEGKLGRYLAPLRRRGMILELDINRSDVLFGVEEGKIRVGLCTVPGLATETAERIVRVRGRGGFRSIGEFVRKVGEGKMTREDVKALIDAGAFDFADLTRGEMTELLPGLFGNARREPARPTRKGQLELPFDA